MASMFDAPPLSTTRPGVDAWLMSLWFVGFEHGTTLVRRMQDAAQGRYAVSPVDADMVLESLLRLEWVRQVGKPSPTHSQRAFLGLHSKALIAPCWYGYEPMRESALVLYARHRELYPVVQWLPGDEEI